MIDSTTFRTQDLDIAAYLEANGHSSSIGRHDGDPLASFTFRRNSELIHLLEQYITGEAVVSVRALLSCRRRLFRSVRAMGGGHHV